MPPILSFFCARYVPMKPNPFDPPKAIEQKNELRISSQHNSSRNSLIITVALWFMIGGTTFTRWYQILPFAFVVVSGIIGAVPAILRHSKKLMFLGPLISGATVTPLLVLIYLAYESHCNDDWANFPSFVWAPGMIFVAAFIGAFFGTTYVVVHSCKEKLVVIVRRLG